MACVYVGCLPAACHLQCLITDNFLTSLREAQGLQPLMAVGVRLVANCGLVVAFRWPGCGGAYVIRAVLSCTVAALLCFCSECNLFRCCTRAAAQATGLPAVGGMVVCVCCGHRLL